MGIAHNNTPLTASAAITAMSVRRPLPWWVERSGKNFFHAAVAALATCAGWTDAERAAHLADIGSQRVFCLTGF